MPRYTVRDSKWKVFIDGVEVPWQMFSVQVGVDNYGMASITMEHDPILLQLRPRSMVHIFMWDGFEDVSRLTDEEADKKAYKLWWEGDLEGFTDSRTPTARNFIIQAVGLFTAFARHRIFLSGVGKIPQTPLISGSALALGSAAYPKQLFSYSLLGEVFAGASDAKIPISSLTGDDDLIYAERLLKLLTYISSYSASMRLQSVRTNLFGKIASMPDKTLAYMIPRSLASSYFKNANNVLPANSTALDLIRTFNDFAYHHFVSTTGSHLPKDQPKSGDDLLIKPVGLSDDMADVFAIPRSFKRNDYLILPETFYAIPPSCNLIFPEFIESMQVARNFSSEATRAVIADTHMNSNLVAVSPRKVFRYGVKGMTPAEYWSINKGATYIENEAGDVTSAYIAPASGDRKPVSLLSAMSDVEVEKGIIPVTTFPSFELFSALATTFDMRNKDTADRIRSILKSAPDLDALKKKGNEGLKYIHVLQTLADYNLTLSKFTRAASITMNGHRWLVPGMPGVIMTKEVSYIGWVKSHVFTVEIDGQETSGVEMDYVRPIPSADFGLAKEAEEIINKQLGLASVGKDMVDFYQTHIIDAFSELNRIVQSGLSNLRPFITGQKKATWEEWTRNVTTVETRLLDMYGRARALEPNLPDNTVAFIESAIERPIDFRLSAEERGRLQQGSTVSMASFRPVWITATAVSETITKNMVGWGNDQIKEVDKAVAEKRVPDVTDAGRAPTSQHIAKYKSVLNELKQGLAALPEGTSGKAIGQSALIRDNFPFPPIFANPDLISVKEAEKIYKELFGAQEVFSQFAKESGKSTVNPTSQDIGGLYVAIENARAYSKFLGFLQALEKIFPVGGNPSGGSVWEQKRGSTDTKEAVRDWEEREILRRPSMQSLDEFLKANNLDLRTETSDPPTPTKFYRMIPKKSVRKKVRNEDGKEMVWDDTIFSKIVDDFALAPRTLNIGTAGPTKSDDEIDKLRKSIKDPLMTTAARQELLLGYARTHFGSRGYDAT